MFFLLAFATLEMPKCSWYLHGVARSTHYGKGLFLAKGYTNLICKLNIHSISYHLLSPPSSPSITKCAHLHTPTSHLHTPNDGVYPRKNKRLVCVPLDHGFLTHGGEVGEGPKDISYILIKMSWSSLRGSSLLCGHKPMTLSFSSIHLVLPLSLPIPCSWGTRLIYMRHSEFQKLLNVAHPIIENSLLFGIY